VRVAWLGPPPSNRSSVAYAETQLLEEIVSAGLEVDCYVTGSPGDLPPSLMKAEALRFICEPLKWDWGRWYSRSPLASFVTGQGARALAQRRLARVVAANHAHRAYDLLLQFSQIELFGPQSALKRLPPLVLFPSVHIAGELRWHRRESALARMCEPPLTHLASRAMLIARSVRQRQAIQLATLVIALSRRFGEHLCRDYGVSPERIRIVPYPIDLNRFSPRPGSGRPTGPMTLLFPARMSVRKGVELVVALSQRLSDLAGVVQIVAVGGETLWSRYTPLLEGLNGEIASYRGEVNNAKLEAMYREADAVLQPSHYEPFALTVGEALASGVPIVASDEVGAVEDVNRRCCNVFKAGELEAFEHAVRTMVARLRTDERMEIKALARSEAERLFAPPTVAAQLTAHLEEHRSAVAMNRLETSVT
jgi:glycosyltransferase involved in cell wall biosynthesis